MARLNKTCLVCGKNYSYCYSCPADLQHPSWKSVFDVENCKEVFNVLSKHGQGMLTNEEAKEWLNKCDLSHKDNFAEKIKNHINQIFGIEVVNEEILGELIVEEVEVVNDVVAELTSDVKATNLPKMKNKKKYKK